MNANIINGLVAGFAATVVLSILMVIKSMIGLLPAMNVVAMLGAMSGTGLIGGWVIHFLIGTVVWGVLFALLVERIPGDSTWLKGILFGVGAWVLMMVLVLPMAGAGLFGLNLGIMAPIMTLILHVIYGAVLGAAYGRRLAGNLATN